jgi:hypothetical protein
MGVTEKELRMATVSELKAQLKALKAAEKPLILRYVHDRTRPFEEKIAELLDHARHTSRLTLALEDARRWTFWRR